eukprot:4644363-Amphidinium_carterae.1
MQFYHPHHESRNSHRNFGVVRGKIGTYSRNVDWEKCVCLNSGMVLRIFGTILGIRTRSVGSENGLRLPDQNRTALALKRIVMRVLLRKNAVQVTHPNPFQ